MCDFENVFQEICAVPSSARLHKWKDLQNVDFGCAHHNKQRRARSHDMSVTESSFYYFRQKAPTLNINEMVEVNTHYLLSAALEPGRLLLVVVGFRSLSHCAKKTRFSRLAHHHDRWNDFARKTANKKIWRFAMCESPPHSTPHLLSSGWVRRTFQLKLISISKVRRWRSTAVECICVLRPSATLLVRLATKQAAAAAAAKKLFFWLLLY